MTNRKFKVGDRVRLLKTPLNEKYCQEYEIIKMKYGQIVEENSGFYKVKFPPYGVCLLVDDSWIELVEKNEHIKKEELDKMVEEEEKSLEKCFNLLKNKPITDNGECKMPVKEEFKIDKVSHYYRCKNKDIVKILHISKNKYSEPVTFIHLDEDTVNSCSTDGKKFDHEFNKYMEDNDNDIIEYIGPELLKEPREFKFKTTSSVISNIINNINNISLHSLQNFIIEIEKNSKWQITMREIIE